MNDETYTGSGLTPVPTSVKAFTGTLQQTLERGDNKDYVVKANSYSNNVNAGTASLVLQGKGNFNGEKTVNFTIKPKAHDISMSCDTGTYNGVAQALVKYTTTISNPQIYYSVGTQINAPSGTVNQIPTRTDAGSYTVYWYAPEGNYTEAKGNLTCTIGRAGVAFPSCASKEYNASSQTLFAANTSTTGYYTNSAITGTNVANNYTGNLTPTANYKWSDTNGTGARTLTCAITQKAVTVTAGSSSRAWNGSALTNSSCTASGLASSSHTVSCSMTSGSTITTAGSVANTINTVAIMSGSTNVTSNYNITKATGTLTVSLATPSVSLTGNSKSWNNAVLTPNSPTVSPNAGGSVSYTYYNSTNCSGGAISSPTTAGNYSVIATVAAVANKTNIAYSNCAAHTISRVASACPTITDTTVNYDGQPHTIGVSGGSGGTIQYKVGNGSWSNTNPSLINVGSQTVNVRVVGDSNHTDQSNCGSKTVTVNAANLSGSVTITGTNKVGQQLSANVTNTNNASLTYQWYFWNWDTSKWVAISGATGANYTPVGQYIGTELLLNVYASKTNYNNATWDDRTDGTNNTDAKVIEDKKYTTIKITGTNKVGETLGVDIVSNPFNARLTDYQWWYCPVANASCTAISGATSSTYTVQEAYQNYQLAVSVYARKDGYVQWIDALTTNENNGSATVEAAITYKYWNWKMTTSTYSHNQYPYNALDSYSSLIEGYEQGPFIRTSISSNSTVVGHEVCESYGSTILCLSYNAYNEGYGNVTLAQNKLNTAIGATYNVYSCSDYQYIKCVTGSGSPYQFLIYPWTSTGTYAIYRQSQQSGALGRTCRVNASGASCDAEW